MKENEEANTLTNFDFFDFVEVFVVAERVELLVGLGGIPESLALVFLFPFFFSSSLAFSDSSTGVSISY